MQATLPADSRAAERPAAASSDVLAARLGAELSGIHGGAQRMLGDLDPAMLCHPEVLGLLREALYNVMAANETLRDVGARLRGLRTS